MHAWRVFGHTETAHPSSVLWSSRDRNRLCWVGSRLVVVPLAVADPVGPHRRVMEQGRTLRGRVLLGKPFEGVEQDMV